jgi:hypothetical protein
LTASSFCWFPMASLSWLIHRRLLFLFFFCWPQTIFSLWPVHRRHLLFVGHRRHFYNESFINGSSCISHRRPALSLSLAHLRRLFLLATSVFYFWVAHRRLFFLLVRNGLFIIVSYRRLPSGPRIHHIKNATVVSICCMSMNAFTVTYSMDS